MPRNSKNSTKGNSNQFELLDIEGDSKDDNTIGSTSAANATSMRGRPLKHKQPYDPESSPRKKSVPTNVKATKTSLDTNEDQLLRFEALLKCVEKQRKGLKNGLNC